MFQVIDNHTGIENRRYKLYQVKEALKDPQAWMLCSIAFLQCIPGGGLTSVRAHMLWLVALLTGHTVR
jgi:ACS family allantoate permease-like MFS transporter